MSIWPAARSRVRGTADVGAVSAAIEDQRIRRGSALLRRRRHSQSTPLHARCRRHDLLRRARRGSRSGSTSIEGVQASVNFATEQARVEFPDTRLTRGTGRRGRGDRLHRGAAARRRRLVRTEIRRSGRVGAMASAAADLGGAGRHRWSLLSMVPALQFDNWQWLAFALASPVVVWGAWPFHKAAWTNLRHGAATMDTLISVGVTAALRCGRCGRCSSPTPARPG